MQQNKQQFNIYLPSNLIRLIKHRSVDEQLSLSDFVEKVCTEYLTKENNADNLKGEKTSLDNQLAVQPMIHIEDMDKALQFYRCLGGSIVQKSPDNDWVLLQLGISQISLLAHPANPEQDEDKVELNFEYEGDLQQLEQALQEKGVQIIQPTTDEEFGKQLQVQGPDGMLIKINQIAF